MIRYLLLITLMLLAPVAWCGDEHKWLNVQPESAPKWITIAPDPGEPEYDLATVDRLPTSRLTPVGQEIRDLRLRVAALERKIRR